MAEITQVQVSREKSTQVSSQEQVFRYIDRIAFYPYDKWFTGIKPYVLMLRDEFEDYGFKTKLSEKILTVYAPIHDVVIDVPDGYVEIRKYNSRKEKTYSFQLTYYPNTKNAIIFFNREDGYVMYVLYYVRVYVTVDRKVMIDILLAENTEIEKRESKW